MRLLEAGLFSQAQSRQFTLADPFQEGLAQVFLQAFEFHGRSIARGYTEYTGYSSERVKRCSKLARVLFRAISTDEIPSR